MPQPGRDETRDRHWAECQATDPDTRIRGCTAVIESGLEPREGLVVALYNRASAYQTQGDYDRAIQDYDAAIRLDASDPDTFLNRGVAYGTRGNHARAIRDFDAAIRLDPSNARAFNNRGSSYMAKGTYKHALRDYDEAIRLDPGYAKAFRLRGDVYTALGDHAHASQDYEAALRLERSLVRVVTNRGEARPATRDSFIRPANAPAPSGEVVASVRRIAFDCAAALDRGDKTTAKHLAKQGLELATRSGDSKWTRRLQHLFRVATDQPIPLGPPGPTDGPSCFFCGKSGAGIIAGPGGLICTDCVKLCSANRLEDSGIERVVSDTGSCGFCGQRSPGEPLFSAQNYSICGRCVQRCLEITSDNESDSRVGVAWVAFYPSFQ